MSELKHNKSINYNSFSEYCFHKDELPPETRHTVEVLLRVAGTNDCLEAEKVRYVKESKILVIMSLIIQNFHNQDFLYIV